jgi:hypothetical protein
VSMTMTSGAIAGSEAPLNDARLQAAERGLEEAERLLDRYHRTLTGPVGWSLRAIGAAPAEGVEHTLDAIEEWCDTYVTYSNKTNDKAQENNE